MNLLLTIATLLPFECNALQKFADWRKRRELIRNLIDYAGGKLRFGYNRGALGIEEILQLLRRELGLRFLEIHGNGRGRVALIPIEAYHPVDTRDRADSGASIRVYYTPTEILSRGRRRDIERSLTRIFSGGIA